MKRLAITFVVLTAGVLYAMSPLMRRGPAPELSAIDAIRAATKAIETRGPQYYCGEVQLIGMVPNGFDKRLLERHWAVTFYDSQRERGVGPNGTETFGDILVRVTLRGEVFDVQELFFGSCTTQPSK